MKSQQTVSVQNGVEVPVWAEVQAAVTRLSTDCRVYVHGHLPSLYVDLREEIHGFYICWENTRCNVFVTCLRRLLGAGEVTAVTQALLSAEVFSLITLEVIKTLLLINYLVCKVSEITKIFITVIVNSLKPNDGWVTTEKTIQTFYIWGTKTSNF